MVVQVNKHGRGAVMERERVIVDVFGGTGIVSHSPSKAKHIEISGEQYRLLP